MEQRFLELAKERPADLVLSVDYQDRNRYELIIHQISDDLCNFAQISREEYLGLTPYDLFPNNHICIDEWYDFILRCMTAPRLCGGVKLEGGFGWCVLQLYSSISIWRETCIIFWVEKGEVEIRFFHPVSPEIQLPRERLMLLKQWRHLAELNSNEGTFQIDAESNIIFLSRSLSQLMKTGEHPTLFTMEEFDAMVMPADLPALRRWIAAHESGVPQPPISGRMLSAESEYTYYKLYGQAVYNEDGSYSGIIGRGENLTEKRMAEEAYTYLKKHDSLTDLLNRNYFEQLLADLDKEENTKYGICICDVNGLRLINDGFGQKEGNRVLVRFADLLREIMPKRSSLFRLGGSEFAVIFHEITSQEINRLIRELTRQVEYSNTIPPLRIAVGGAAYGGEERDALSVFRRAEERMLANKLLQRDSSRGHIIQSLKQTLRIRNLETADHTDRLERMSRVLGERLGLTTSECTKLELLASMHDIGKVAIPDAIINKDGALADDEWEIMKTHTKAGARIAMSSGDLATIAKEIACHHECWDGTGYPYGYKGEEIPMLSRVISVVDAYDVMTHQRVYKKSIKTHEEAIEELRRCAGTQFDPAVVEAFLQIFSEYSDADMHRFFDAE